MTFRVRLRNIRPKIPGILDDRFWQWFQNYRSTPDAYHVSRWEAVR